jgi:hypothetical protein
VSDVPRAVERLTTHRTQPAKPAAGNGDPFGRPREDTGRPAQDGLRPGSDLDDYFDRLDAAFANIATPGDAPPPARPPEVMRREGPVMERDLDWFDSASAEQAQPSPRQAPPPQPPSHEHVIDVSPVPAPVPEPVPVTFANPPVPPSWSAPQPPSIEPPDSPPARASQPARPVQPAPTVSADATSAIADAFSALLAAEQGDADAPPVRLPVAGTLQVTDEMVDEVARRVVERLGSHAVHDLVAEVVSRIAERLVREEIERIRNKHS